MPDFTITYSTFLFECRQTIVLHKTAGWFSKKWLLFLVIWEDEKLSAVRKVLETLLFLALGSFETLGSKLSYGTS